MKPKHTHIVSGLLVSSICATHLTQEEEPRCGIRAHYGIDDSFKKNNLHDPNPDYDPFKNADIAAGRDASLGEFPWQVSFRGWLSKENFCGGVLIDREHILTAAHCFIQGVRDDSYSAQEDQTDEKSATRDNNGNIIYHPGMTQQFKVAVGWQRADGQIRDLRPQYEGLFMRKFGTFMYSIDIRPNSPNKKGEVIIHRDYHHGCTKNSGGVCYENDIAIVKLGKPIKFNNCSDSIKGYSNDNGCVVYGTFVRPICLPRIRRPLQPRTLTGVPDIPAKLRLKIKKDEPSNMWITGYGRMTAKNPNKKTEAVKPEPDCDFSKNVSCIVHAKELQVAQQIILEKKKCQIVINKRACKSQDGQRKMPDKVCETMIEKFKYEEPKKAFKLAKGQICAITNPEFPVIQDICKGDSGGPISFAVDYCLAFKNKHRYKKCTEKYRKGKRTKNGKYKHDSMEKYEQYQLYGLISFGDSGECGQTNYPGFYTDVHHYMDWIKSSIDSSNLQYAGERL